MASAIEPAQLFQTESHREGSTYLLRAFSCLHRFVEAPLTDQALKVSVTAVRQHHINIADEESQ